MFRTILLWVILLGSIPVLAQNKHVKVDDWLKAIKDLNPENRISATYSYSQISEDSVYVSEQLIHALSDSDPFVRQSVAFVIAEHELKNEKTLAALSEALKDSVDAVRLMASSSLIRFGTVSIPYLLVILKEEPPPFIPADTSDYEHHYLPMSQPAISAAIALQEIQKEVPQSIFLSMDRPSSYAKIALEEKESQRRFDFSRNIRWELLLNELEWRYEFGRQKRKEYNPWDWKDDVENALQGLQIIPPADSNLLKPIRKYKQAFINYFKQEQVESSLQRIIEGLYSDTLDIANYNLQLLSYLDVDAYNAIGKALVESEDERRKMISNTLLTGYIKYNAPQSYSLETSESKKEKEEETNGVNENNKDDSVKDPWDFAGIRLRDLEAPLKYSPPEPDTQAYVQLRTSMYQGDFLLYLKRSLLDPQPELRQNAIKILSKYFPAESDLSSCYIEALEQINDELKEDFIEQMFFYQQSRYRNADSLEIDWLSILEPYIQPSKSFYSSSLFEFFGKIANYDSRLIPIILKGLEDKDISVRLKAIQKLKDIRKLPPEMVNMLKLRMQKEEHVPILMEYLELLKSQIENGLTCEPFFADMENLLTHPDWELRYLAYKTLPTCLRDRVKTIELFKNGLKDKNEKLRAKILSLLIDFPNRDSTLLEDLINHIPNEKSIDVQRSIYANIWGRFGYMNDSIRKSVGIYEMLSSLPKSREVEARKLKHIYMLRFHPRNVRLDNGLIEILDDSIVEIKQDFLQELWDLNYRNSYNEPQHNLHDSRIEKSLKNIIQSENSQELRYLAVNLHTKIADSTEQTLNFWNQLLEEELNKDSIKILSPGNISYEREQFEDLINSIPYVLFKVLGKTTNRAERFLSNYLEHPNIYLRAAARNQQVYNIELSELALGLFLNDLMSENPELRNTTLNYLKKLISEQREFLTQHPEFVEALLFLLPDPEGKNQKEFFYMEEWTLKDLLRQDMESLSPLMFRYFDNCSNEACKREIFNLIIPNYPKWDAALRKMAKEMLNSSKSEVKAKVLNELSSFKSSMERQTAEKMGEIMLVELLPNMLASLEDTSLSVRIIAMEFFLESQTQEYIGRDTVFSIVSEMIQELRNEDRNDNLYIINPYRQELGKFITYGENFFPEDSSFWYNLLLIAVEETSGYGLEELLKEKIEKYPQFLNFLTRELARGDQKVQIFLAKFFLKYDLVTPDINRLILKFINDQKLEEEFYKRLEEIKDEYFKYQVRLIRIYYSMLTLSHSIEFGEYEYGKLPWPPPLGTTRDFLPSEFLGSDSDTLETVVNNLVEVLKDAGYKEHRVYETEGGIAVLTKLERIYEDVRPYDSTNRWTQKELPPLNIGEYLSSLLLGTKGNYRVMLFIISEKEDFDELPKEVASGNRMRALYAAGRHRLTKSLKSLPYKDKFVHCIIYQFEKRNGGETLLVKDSPYVVDDHLEKAGFMEKLRLAKQNR